MSATVDEMEAIQAQLDANRAAQRKLSERTQALIEQLTTVTRQRLSEITNEQLLADAQLRTWLCEAASWLGDAAQRMRTLVPTSRHVDPSGQDGRQGTYHLPGLTVLMERDTDAVAVAAEVAAWFEVWGLGRTDLRISVLEHTCSEFGSYNIHYQPGGPVEATLIHGHGRIQIRGSLAEVLAYVAERHPLTRPRSDWDDD
jgi:hypothetical protein